MNDLLSRVLVYLKGIPPATVAAHMALGTDDSPVMTRLTDDVTITYVLDEPEGLVFIKRRDLHAAGVTVEQLHLHATANLDTMCDARLRVEKHGPVFGVFLDGNFEASVFLRERFWHYEAARLVDKGFAIAMPARDVLAFCDMDSKQGVETLQEITRQVTENGDHLLTPTLFRVRKKNLM